MADLQGRTIVYEGWLEKSNISNTDGKSKGKLLQRKKSGSWKKFYFILGKQHDGPKEYSILLYFDKKPPSVEDTKSRKGVTKLWPHYKIEKNLVVKERKHVFVITTDVEKFQLHADSQNSMDLWVFHLQTQTKLRNDLPGSSFIVKAKESNEHRRIGSLGNNCLLHISPWGLTLALQNSRSLVGQWPLKCIRTFESSDDGRFSFEAGRNSPMGEGDYVFITRPNQDNALFDLIDSYTEQANHEQRISASSRSDERTQADDVNEEYDRLRLATFGLLPSQRAAAAAAIVSSSIPVDVPRSSPRQRPGYRHQLSTDESVSEEQDEGGYMRPSSSASGSDSRRIQRSISEQPTQTHPERLPRSNSDLPPLHHHKDATGTYLDMSQTNLSSISREEEPFWTMSGEFKSPENNTSPEPTINEAADETDSAQPSAVKQRRSTGAIPKQKRTSSHPYEDMTSPGTSYENALSRGISYENAGLVKGSPGVALGAYENQAFVSSPSSFTKSLPKRFQFKEKTDSVNGSRSSGVVYSQVQHGVRKNGGKPPPYLELEDELTSDQPLTSPRLVRSASYDNIIAKMSLSPDVVVATEGPPPLPDWLPNRRLPAPPPGTVNLDCTHSYLDIDIQGGKAAVGSAAATQRPRKHKYEHIEGDFEYEVMQRKMTMSRSQSDSNLLGDSILPPPVPNTPRPSLKTQQSQDRNSGGSTADSAGSSHAKDRPVSGTSVSSQDDQASGTAPASLSKIKSPLGMKIKTSKKTKTFTKRNEEIEIVL